MRGNILVYGATGYSGQLIAAEGKAAGMSSARPDGDFRMILAARDTAMLREVANRNAMSFRAFALDDVGDIKKHLDGIDVVINAAGPFAFTAEKLTKAALTVGCHYVDISGEVDVYRQLDDLARDAAQRKIAIVSGAGYTAGASDILLDLALQKLKNDGTIRETKGELGAVRIALSAIADFSRGSALTLARSMREQVIVVRKGPTADGKSERMVVWHEPVGKLERTFDFGCLSKKKDDEEDCSPKIASAVNLIDTLTAQLRLLRHGMSANTIESYAQAGRARRMAYQVGRMMAALGTLPLLRALGRAQLSLLPGEPSEEELERWQNIVVLEIEDLYRTRVIDWRWQTPNVYQFTAQLAVAAARSIAPGEKRGWVTPADALGFKLRVGHAVGTTAGFRLQDTENGADIGLELEPSPLADCALRNTKLETRPV